MKLAFKYPVYPTQAEEKTLEKWLDHLCELQNAARNNRKFAHEEGRFVSRYDQEQLLKGAREKSPTKLSLAIRTFNCQFCDTSMDRDHNAALNILLRAACAHRGERWVTNLYETRNLSVDR